MKKITKIILAITGASLLVCSCGNREKKAQQAESEARMTADSLAAAQKESITMEKLANLPEEPVFEINTSEGVIKVKLYSKTPLHRDNFAKLAFSGFYENILFHRVIDGFMIQAGDPLTKDEANAARFGTGGPGYTIPAEFVPEYHHTKGALAAARRGDAANPLKESSGSQFYIVQDERACAPLDGDYTVFGQTVEGLEVIDRIASAQTDQRDRPTRNIKIISIKLAE